MAGGTMKQKPEGFRMDWKAFPVEEQIRITAMYSMFDRHFESGYNFAGEAHDFWECVYVWSGEITESADERIYNLGSGELIFHKPMEFHKQSIRGARGADALIFSFSAQGPLTEWMRDKVFSLSEDQKRIVRTLQNYMQNLSMENGTDRDGYWRRYLGPFEKNVFYAQMVTTYLYQLFLSLADEGEIAPVSSAPDAAVFRKAIRFLKANLYGQPTVPEVARFCNVSEASLKRVFDKYAGIGVHKYLLKMKIKSAMEMLQDGESVSEVAEKLGFNSQSYFSKAFRRETEKMPSRFRE